MRNRKKNIKQKDRKLLIWGCKAVNFFKYVKTKVLVVTEFRNEILNFILNDRNERRVHYNK